MAMDYYMNLFLEEDYNCGMYPILVAFNHMMDNHICMLLMNVSYDEVRLTVFEMGQYKALGLYRV